MKNQRTVHIINLLVLLLILLVGCGGPEADTMADNVPGADESVSLVPEGAGGADGGEIAQDQGDFAQKITEFVEGRMMADGLPGAAVAVVRGDAVVFAEGFGFRDVEKQLPVTPETLFHIGSTNKSMTAMMMATLVDQGLFDWDTPVVEIDPDFALSSAEATEAVTIRHLLSMQSGIPDDAEDDFDVDDAAGEDLFAYVKTVPLLGMPGEQFSYSNISASLAGYLGVMAAGEDAPDLYTGYARLLRRQVFDPIGMSAAVVHVSDAETNPNYGKSYVIKAGNAVAAEREDFDGDPLAPSGTVKANVMDMAAYVSTQLHRGQAPNGTRVVSEENLRETWKPDLENYAMGWEISEHEGHEVIWHDGAYDNYVSVIGFVPDLNMGFVILANSEEAGEGLIDEGPAFLIALVMDS